MEIFEAVTEDSDVVLPGANVVAQINEDTGKQVQLGLVSGLIPTVS